MTDKINQLNRQLELNPSCPITATRLLHALRQAGREGEIWNEFTHWKYETPDTVEFRDGASNAVQEEFKRFQERAEENGFQDAVIDLITMLTSLRTRTAQGAFTAYYDEVRDRVLRRLGQPEGDGDLAGWFSGLSDDGTNIRSRRMPADDIEDIRVVTADQAQRMSCVCSCGRSFAWHGPGAPRCPDYIEGERHTEWIPA